MSEYETTQRKRNVLVGLFVVIGACALAGLLFKFNDFPGIYTKIRSFEVFVQFPTAPGVQEDTPVRFCGYQIGRVTAVMSPELRKDLITGQQYHQTVVVLGIDKRFTNIPSNVEVKLMTRGLGSSYIELKIDPSELPAPPLDPNCPESCFLMDKLLLQGSTGVTSEFFPAESQKKLDELITGLKTFITNANDILGDPNNKANFKATLANLTDASKEAADRLRQAKDTLEHVKDTLSKASQAIEQAKPAIEDFRKLAAAGTDTLKNFDAKAERLVVVLADASGELGRTAAELRLTLEKINSGDGTAGRLVNDGKLYEKLLENTEQVKSMVEQIKAFVEQARLRGLPLKLK